VLYVKLLKDGRNEYDKGSLNMPGISIVYCYCSAQFLRCS